MKKYVIGLLLTGLIFVSGSTPAHAATLLEMQTTVAGILAQVNQLPSNTISELQLKVGLLQGALSLQTQINSLINTRSSSKWVRSITAEGQVGDGPYNLVLYDNEAEYRDQTYKFVLHYPKSWKVNTAGREYVQFSQSDSVGIRFELLKLKTIEQFQTAMREAEKNGLAYNVSTKSGSELGYPGVLITYTAGSHSVINYSIYSREHEGSVYQFILTSMAAPTREQTSALDRIMNTLRFE